MKLLVADEGVDKSIVDALRTDGFSVKYFAEAGSGADDKDVLSAASERQCLLLTCDKDFGELVYRQKLTSSSLFLPAWCVFGPETPRLRLSGEWLANIDSANTWRPGCTDRPVSRFGTSQWSNDRHGDRCEIAQ
jgi:hypothetical protein